VRKYPSAAEIAKLKRPGRYAVGDGAYLQISKWRTRAWVFRYVIDGRTHHMGLGSCSLLTLAEARERSRQARRLLLDGIDPIAAKHAAKHARLLASVKAKTFEQVALEYIAQHEGNWRGDLSRKQWLASLRQHVFPKIGTTPIASIDVTAVLSVLDPIWNTIPETAARVKHRIALILDWAAARELRVHDNPARRPKLLPARKTRAKHFTAIPYTDMGAFMTELRTVDGLPARALEFTILTAVRTGDVLGARWSEINGDAWTIPGERTKSGREHRVPLSDRAVELLAKLPRTSEYVFTGGRTGAQMNVSALRNALHRISADLTVHGFRSAFRDWAAETTAYPNHVVEMALAHAIPNGVESAYRRGDLFEKRRRLMQDWADYCSRPNVEADVVPLRGVS
jgi:integrase